MKKSSTRTVLFTLLVATSIFSYVYLNTVPAGAPAPGVEVGIEEIDGIEGERSDIILPDVQLFKKAIEAGKRFLPAS
jgi:hypothetical protein